MSKQTFPVLFLDDLVVLPDMVVPLELTDQSQGVIDAARAGHDGSHQNLRLLVVPRIDGNTGTMWTVSEVTQIGRLPSGEPAVVLRGVVRARIGTGVSGHGAALWVEADVLTD